MIHPWANEPEPGEPLERRVRRYKLDCYLQGLRCVIWPSGHWDITDDGERAKAVAFLEDLLDSVG